LTCTIFSQFLQYLYFLIDPQSVSGDAFWERLATLSDAVDVQEGARLPGANRQLPNEVSIGSDIWALTQSLAGTD